MRHGIIHKGPEEALFRFWLQPLNQVKSQGILKTSLIFGLLRLTAQLGFLYLHNHYCIWNNIQVKPHYA